MALGNFDGVHRGHVSVLRAAHASRPDVPLAALTFEPHPREFFRPDDPAFRLTLSAERARLLAEEGVKLIYELPFDASFSHLTPERFIAEVLHAGLGAAHLTCGADFAFGHRKGGDTGLLARTAESLGIGLALVPALADAEGPLSSSRARRNLQDGYPERAALVLGRNWSITGPVSEGNRLGRTIRFPTANVTLGRHLEPARGVYAVTARLADGRLVTGVANIGRRPTVNSGPESRLEAHLFDFAEDIYGQEIAVTLHAFLRPEQKFPGLDALRAQIAADSDQARAMFSGGLLHQSANS